MSRKYVFITLVLLTNLLTGCREEGYYKPTSPEPGEAHSPAPEGHLLSSETPRFAWPVRGSVSLSFGAKEEGVSLKGIVIESGSQQRVCASADGRVALVDEHLNGYGKTVILEHAAGFSTVYARNAELGVKAGQIVRQGDPLAKMGRDERTKKWRLYFELRQKVKPVDPSGYLQ